MISLGKSSSSRKLSGCNPSRILAVDPGPTKSAFVCVDCNLNIHSFRLDQNDVLREHIPSLVNCDAILATEAIAYYGKASIFSRDIYHTAFESGRIAEAVAVEAGLPESSILHVRRSDVRLHVCGTVRSNDTGVRAALIDKWGGKETAIGKTNRRGPLYGFKADLWSALAIAVYVVECRLWQKEKQQAK